MGRLLRPSRWLLAFSGVVLLGSLLAGGGDLWAQTPSAQSAAQPGRQIPRPASDGPAWTTLTPAQQKVLEPLKSDWAGLAAAQKSKWLEVATRLPTLPAAEQQRIRERMAEWTRLTPSERGQARLQFQESRQFSEADRRARWDAYQSLPDDAKRQLAERARPAPQVKGPAPSLEAGRGNVTASVNGTNGTGGSTTSGAKRNVVSPTPSTATKPVAPTVVQARPGATTTLVTRPALPPLHQQPGLPKIAATADFVNPSTLLPQRGPQGAAVRLIPVPAAPAAPAAAASAGGAGTVEAVPASATAAATATTAAAAASAASQP